MVLLRRRTELLWWGVVLILGLIVIVLLLRWRVVVVLGRWVTVAEFFELCFALVDQSVEERHGDGDTSLCCGVVKLLTRARGQGLRLT